MCSRSGRNGTLRDHGHRCLNPINCVDSVEFTKKVCVCDRMSEKSSKSNRKKKQGKPKKMKGKEGGLTSVEGPTNLFKQVEDLFRHKKTLFWEMQTELKEDSSEKAFYAEKATPRKHKRKHHHPETEECRKDKIKNHLRQLYCIEKLFHANFKESDSRVFDLKHNIRSMNYKKYLLNSIIEKISTDAYSSAEEDSYIYLALDEAKHYDANIDMNIKKWRLCRKENKEEKTKLKTLARNMFSALQRSERNKRFKQFRRKPYKRHRELAKKMNPNYIIDRDSCCDIRKFNGPFGKMFEAIDRETVKKHKLHQRHYKIRKLNFKYEKSDISQQLSHIILSKLTSKEFLNVGDLKLARGNGRPACPKKMS